MTTTTYADVARLTDALTPDTAEQWCAARDLSADEAHAIWSAAVTADAAHEAVAQSIWADETWWRGGLGHLVRVDDPNVGGWTVPAGEMVAALKRLGWEIDRAQGLALEPEAADPETGGAYQALCDATTPTHQRDTTSDEAWAAIDACVGGELVYRPDLGARTWTLTLPAGV